MLTYHLQLYSLERYMHTPIMLDLAVRPTIISDSYSFVEILVDFIKRRPTSVLELVFKDEAGAQRKSTKFKEGDPVHWNLDRFVHFAASLLSTETD
jgi:hypothetical protein